jgi:hypothetical protein
MNNISLIFVVSTLNAWRQHSKELRSPLIYSNTYIVHGLTRGRSGRCNKVNYPFPCGESNISQSLFKLGYSSSIFYCISNN